MAGPDSFEEYLAKVPEAPRAALERLSRTIKSAAPDATETTSYQMPTFKERSRRKWGDAPVSAARQPLRFRYQEVRSRQPRSKGLTGTIDPAPRRRG